MLEAATVFFDIAGCFAKGRNQFVSRREFVRIVQQIVHCDGIWKPTGIVKFDFMVEYFHN